MPLSRPPLACPWHRYPILVGTPGLEVCLLPSPWDSGKPGECQKAGCSGGEEQGAASPELRMTRVRDRPVPGQGRTVSRVRV